MEQINLNPMPSVFSREQCQDASRCDRRSAIDGHSSLRRECEKAQETMKSWYEEYIETQYYSGVSSGATALMKSTAGCDKGKIFGIPSPTLRLPQLTVDSLASKKEEASLKQVKDFTLGMREVTLREEILEQISKVKLELEQQSLHLHVQWATYWRQVIQTWQAPNRHQTLPIELRGGAPTTPYAAKDCDWRVLDRDCRGLCCVWMGCRWTMTEV